MEVMHSRCAGLDVHKDLVVACVRIQEGRRAQRDVESFGTTTKELLRLLDWLTANEVAAVAMEATGVYWHPVWNILDGAFGELVLANAAHIKNVPGRKTDVKDSEWIADLLAHGLIRSSFVPDALVHELRDYTRTRKQLGREHTRHVQRIQKTLQDANIKIDSFITDIMGQSGRAFLTAIVAGESDPYELAKLGHPSLKASKDELAEALRGVVTDHHRTIIQLHLNLIDALDAEMRMLDDKIDQLIAAHELTPAVELLTTIPGIKATSARIILSEIGFDMGRFPTADHLVSWATLCPRSDESAGKRRSTRIRKGSRWLKPALVQAAMPAMRTKGSRFQSLYRRVKGRKDHKKAIVAVAAELLRIIWHMLTRGVPYQEIGPWEDNPKRKEHYARRLSRKLQDLGYNVVLSRSAPEASSWVSS